MTLLPCPFCGSTEIVRRVHGAEVMNPVLTIRCRACNASISRPIEIGLPRWKAPAGFNWEAVAEREAAEAWNKRTHSPTNA
jgi:Lar family restriction alleviation protein